MSRFTRRTITGALAALSAPAILRQSASAQQPVEIEYWQYTFAQRVQAMDELIKRFEAANPTIKVKQVTVPYDDFRVKIAAAIPAGQGPDVVQLFYGWLHDYMKAKMLQPFVRGEQEGADGDSGLGLGLSIAREIVTAQGGTLTLQDREPHGLAVRIELPAWPERVDNLAKIA
mgnify:CR=1 FL=1